MLIETSVPPDTKIVVDGNVEMAWPTFAGQHEELYWALTRLRCAATGANSAFSAASSFASSFAQGFGGQASFGGQATDSEGGA